MAALLQVMAAASLIATLRIYTYARLRKAPIPWHTVRCS